MNSRQYTIRGVPPELDRVLREEARKYGKSLNTVVIETLEQAKLPSGPPYHDLDWFIGSGRLDEEAETEMQDWLDSLPRDLPL